MNGFWSGSQSRRIVERILIEGDFVLQTPAHFGSGDSDNPNVMELMQDAYDGSPLLPGASIAGALRAYLWGREVGIYDPDMLNQPHAYRHTLTVMLFGGLRSDDSGEQSRLIVEDSIGQAAARVERDGVGLNTETHTANDNFFYRIQLWDVGTCFPLRFELLIYEGDDAAALKHALGAALSGLSDGSITLGARKRRGFGRGAVAQWRVKQFDMRDVNGLMSWLRAGNNPLPDVPAHSTIFAAMDIEDTFPSATPIFEIDAFFTLDGSLLIRAFDVEYTDMRHLRSAGHPILSGTSLTGALRSRARKILRTLNASDLEQRIEQVFGSPPRAPGNEKIKLKGSRLTVEEHPIKTNAPEQVQSRVSIDRFTAGALDTALFSQSPIFASERSGVRVRLQLRVPQAGEIGLLLLLLKDLWTGDLTLGGERSIGRGQLRGERAVITYEGDEWIIEADSEGRLMLPTNAARLAQYLSELHQSLENQP